MEGGGPRLGNFLGQRKAGGRPAKRWKRIKKGTVGHIDEIHPNTTFIVRVRRPIHHNSTVLHLTTEKTHVEIFVRTTCPLLTSFALPTIFTNSKKISSTLYTNKNQSENDIKNQYSNYFNCV